MGILVKPKSVYFGFNQQVAAMILSGEIKKVFVSLFFNK